MSCAHEGLFRACFTDEILGEWTRNLIALKPRLADSVRQQEEVIRREFFDCMVTGHMEFVDSLDLPDPGDRHVPGAAIRCGAQVIVTENRRDFPAGALEPCGVETLTADEMLTNTCDLFPVDMVRVLSMVRRRDRSPPMNASAFLIDLTRNGLPMLASMARRDVEML